MKTKAKLPECPAATAVRLIIKSMEAFGVSCRKKNIVKQIIYIIVQTKAVS